MRLLLLTIAMIPFLCFSIEREKMITEINPPFVYSCEDFVERHRIDEHLQRYKELLLTIPTLNYWVKIIIETPYYFSSMEEVKEFYKSWE